LQNRTRKPAKKTGKMIVFLVGGERAGGKNKTKHLATLKGRVPGWEVQSNFPGVEEVALATKKEGSGRGEFTKDHRLKKKGVDLRW